MTDTQHDFVLPNLDLGDAPIVSSVWHVAAGSRVSQGESLLEVLAGEVVVDLPAPASGILIQKLVVEDEPLQTGQRLAVISIPPGEPT